MAGDSTVTTEVIVRYVSADARANELRAGAVESTITHISIDSRLIGRAQLVIVASPSAAKAILPGTTVAGQ